MNCPNCNEPVECETTHCSLVESRNGKWFDKWTCAPDWRSRALAAESALASDEERRALEAVYEAAKELQCERCLNGLRDTKDTKDLGRVHVTPDGAYLICDTPKLSDALAAFERSPK